MPNRKIKHIVAKLVGASTEETLDVYDVDAVHTADIANNLTTTNEGYVLDARQGKALNDSLANLSAKSLIMTTLYTFTGTGDTDVVISDIFDYPVLVLVLVNTNNHFINSTVIGPGMASRYTTYVYGPESNQWGRLVGHSGGTTFTFNRTTANTASVALYGIKFA